MDKKLTDNEIIKALECCGNIVDSTCKGCVYHETYNASCVVRLMRDALDLINRQKAEIESLKHRKTELQIRNQELQHEKSEAIKEFAERLKTYKMQPFNYDRYLVPLVAIDEAVKEMTGQNDLKE